MALESKKLSDFDSLLHEKGCVICRLPQDEKCWGIFHSPIKILCAKHYSEVLPALLAVEQELAQGNFVAGFISYEAGFCFDSAFPRQEPSDLPLLWFGVYAKAPDLLDLHDDSSNLCGVELGSLEPDITRQEYEQALQEIFNGLRCGNIYQTNYTFRLKKNGINIDCGQLFKALNRAHPVPYAAYVNIGETVIVSASPELFLTKRGENIFTSPMKGTMPRGKDRVEDERNRQFLRHDTKNLAENLMIVDMARNDLGRIAKVASVKVDPLFQVDSYKTVHQMISTVHAKVAPEVSFSDILKATFPAASITGAPKIAAMHYIKNLEHSPRGIYTGAIGCVFPNQDFVFNVAIRTLLCQEDSIELGIGGGIVYDSKIDSEWEEALLKGSFLKFAEEDFCLIETLRYAFADGFIDLDEHLQRLEKAAIIFDFKYERQQLEAELQKELVKHLSQGAVLKVRLELHRDGGCQCDCSALHELGWGKECLAITFSQQRTDSKNEFLRYKTTKRKLYNEELTQARAGGFDEVLFLNEKDEVTEGAISNIFIKKDGKWLTPPVTSGLLPGVWRAKMLKKLKATECVIHRDDVINAESILLGNSVRGGARAKFATRQQYINNLSFG